MALERTRRSGIAAIGVACVLALASCGGEQYRYVESDDGHMFGKIPHDWSIDSEGAVNFTFIDPNQPTDVAFAFTSDDTTRPWRARFSAPGATGEVPAGSFESQHIDARIRNGFLLREQIDDFTARVGATDVERTKVTVGGMEGYRVAYTVGAGDDAVDYEEVFLVNDRRSGIYITSVRCSSDCMTQYRDEIDEVLSEFWVDL